jgi:F0F1-type ATP synthase delta subunit
MNLPIISHIYSVEDKVYMLEKLAVLEAGIYSTKKTFEEQVHDQFSLFLAESLLKTFIDAKVSFTAPDSIQKYLREIQTSIKALPQVTIRVAIAPNPDLIRSIAKWFDAYFGDKTVVAYMLDPHILGGVAIEWNGSYIDLTLRKKLTETLKQKGNAAQH